MPGTIIAEHVEIIQLQVRRTSPRRKKKKEREREREREREKKERTWDFSWRLFMLISQPCTVSFRKVSWRSNIRRNFTPSRRILLSEGSSVLGGMVGFRIGGARLRCTRYQAGARWLPIQFAPSERKRVGKSIHRAWNDWFEMQLKGYRLVAGELAGYHREAGSFRWSIVEFTRHANSLLRRDFS